MFLSFKRRAKMIFLGEEEKNSNEKAQQELCKNQRHLIPINSSLSMAHTRSGDKI
jgi:hypothetical protein